MMNNTRVEDRNSTLIANLVYDGFTVAEIARLAQLRDRYPIWEFVESRREWDYLQFTRWEYERGIRRK